MFLDEEWEEYPCDECFNDCDDIDRQYCCVLCQWYGYDFNEENCKYCDSTDI